MDKDTKLSLHGKAKTSNIMISDSSRDELMAENFL